MTIDEPQQVAAIANQPREMESFNLQQDIKVQRKHIQLLQQEAYCMGDHGKGCELPLLKMCEMSKVEAYKITMCTIDH